MNSKIFDVELSKNRAAYQRLIEQLRHESPGKYAAIAQGRLIGITESFDDAVAEIEELVPPPEHFLVFPVDEEPAFDVIDDFVEGI